MQGQQDTPYPAADGFTQALVHLLKEIVASRPPERQPAVAPASWRERLWVAPPDTRLGVVELCEALGRSKGFVYRLTRNREIPFRKLDGVLVFRVGDIRSFLQDREHIVVTVGLRHLADVRCAR